MLAREAAAGFQRQMQALDAARREASTGTKVSRPSDDPVAAAGIMQSDSGLRALDQYRKNLESGQARLNVEDSVLDQLSNALIRAKELAISQADDTASAETRKTSQAEVDRLIDFVKDLADTQLAGRYLFGGQYADSAPYGGGALDPAKPPSGSFPIEVGAGQFVETNHSAQEIFVDSDVVDSLTALSTALGADDTTAVQSALTRLDAAFDAVQEKIGDLGARMNQLDIGMSNIESLGVNLQTFRSKLSDADLSAAVTELVSRQNTLQAAMLANSRILDLTLTDYLR